MPFDEAVKSLEDYAGDRAAAARHGEARPRVFNGEESYESAIDTMFDTYDINADCMKELGQAAKYSKVNVIRYLRQIGFMSACRRDLRAQFMGSRALTRRSADRRRYAAYGLDVNGKALLALRTFLKDAEA